MTDTHELSGLPFSVTHLTLDLTTVAHLFLIVETVARPEALATLDSSQLGYAEAVRTMWCGLTGLDADAAVEVAQAITRHPLPVTAAVCPF